MAACHLFGRQWGAVVGCVGAGTRWVALDASASAHQLCDLGHVIIQSCEVRFLTCKVWVITGQLHRAVVELNMLLGWHSAWHTVRIP